MPKDVNRGPQEKRVLRSSKSEGKRVLRSSGYQLRSGNPETTRRTRNSKVKQSEETLPRPSTIRPRKKKRTVTAEERKPLPPAAAEFDYEEVASTFSDKSEEPGPDEMLIGPQEVASKQPTVTTAEPERNSQTLPLQELGPGKVPSSSSGSRPVPIPTALGRVVPDIDNESRISVHNPYTHGVTVPPVVQNHQKFWFPDGSVFIQLMATRFRLHQSRLANASRFFAELFRKRASSYMAEELDIELKSGDTMNVSVAVKELNGMDLYILDKIGVDSLDFEVLVDILDNGVAHYWNAIPFSTLERAVRAATTLQCNAVQVWAIARTKEQWSTPSFLQPIPDAAEAFILAQKYKISEIMTRVVYELLRTEEVADTAHLEIPRERFLEAREKLRELWLAVAQSPDNSTVTCPLIFAGASTVQLCVSTSPLDVLRVHEELVGELVLKQHCWDPLGGLEHLISMDELWKGAGYCYGCVHLRRRLWEKRKEELQHEHIWSKDS